VRRCALLHSYTLTLIHTLSYTLSHTHSLTLIHSLIHTLSHSYTLSHTHSLELHSSRLPEVQAALFCRMRSFHPRGGHEGAGAAPHGVYRG
jgi:hypothetical protein